jgi:uncharacterized protein YndB with AHSA1/START domain
MQTSATDRIEKTAVLRAPRSRVWRALSDAREFSAWFLTDFEGEFAAGATLRGRPRNPGYEHLTIEIRIERMEPERYFSFRWHPYEVDLSKDSSTAPTTLVEFTLEDAPDGTRLTVTESGFDALPPGRRFEAFRENESGWTEQMQNVRRYVEGA